MNGVELFLLGRTLMKIGEDALPTEGIGDHTTSVRTVLIVRIDVAEHPDSAIGEIAARTGLPQSRVSEAVARLRATGVVETAPDPRDRRRMLVRQSSEISPRAAQVAATPVDDALAAALGTGDPERVARVVALLESLAEQLTPEALRRMRPAR
ncbi:MarR family winged helix-turn-helix transcriptional regulator [Sphaerisporangium krabiense]|uniref:DNA-binding MarR family transcriptional regulator n=1 Tax=Sphaerisporangium krabiense TaxID=763782 RepID=A0A7W8Z185_9ACTN|nr:MarR family transcriptional regulator [Sphaerisporangium krabiense]MBB5625541.1 DNA-binding MarR family transcriptional regulator [Sphaerisporangium krabiense]